MFIVVVGCGLSSSGRGLKKYMKPFLTDMPFEGLTGSLMVAVCTPRSPFGQQASGLGTVARQVGSEMVPVFIVWAAENELENTHQRVGVPARTWPRNASRSLSPGSSTAY